MKSISSMISMRWSSAAMSAACAHLLRRRDRQPRQVPQAASERVGGHMAPSRYTVPGGIRLLLHASHQPLEIRSNLQPGPTVWVSEAVWGRPTRRTTPRARSEWANGGDGGRHEGVGMRKGLAVLLITIGLSALCGSTNPQVASERVR
jgi:hypothetical protein